MGIDKKNLKKVNEQTIMIIYGIKSQTRASKNFTKI